VIILFPIKIVHVNFSVLRLSLDLKGDYVTPKFLLYDSDLEPSLTSMHGRIGDPFWCREHRPRTRSQENRMSENAFVNMFPFSNPTLPRQVVWRERTRINMADKRKLSQPFRNMVSNTPVRPCFQGYHSRPFETTECVRAFPARLRNAEEQGLEYAPEPYS
jgi:hypothetical protein